MPEPSIEPDSNVRAVMDAYPETIIVFLRRRMHCAGCVMAPFMTLAEAAANYGVDTGDLVGELRAAVPIRPGDQA